MKILMLFPYAPLPPPHDLGGTKRNLPFLLENLKRHDVAVIAYGKRRQEDALRTYLGDRCREISFVDTGRKRWQNGVEQIFLLLTGRSPFRQFFRQAMQDRIDAYCASHPVDLIHCCTQLLGCFTFPAGVTVVTDTHEVTFDLFRRFYQSTRRPLKRLWYYLQYRFGKPEEIRLCNRFDALVATTERDAEVFRAVCPAQEIHVVGNGVDPGFLEELPDPVVPASLVFTGKMSYFPNHQGILWFLDEVFPLILRRRPDSRITVVGISPGKELLARASERVAVTGFVEDVRPYIARAEVFVIPLLVGGGIRGKALEAMAMRKAIVSTRIGCEGIDLVHDRSALFADDPAGFARAVVGLFDDRALRERLGACARETVEKEYNWSAQGEKLSRVYARAAERRRGRTNA